MTLNKEIIIPWRAENIDDVILDPQSYLDRTSDDGSCTYRTYFKEVREVYFGDVKAFMVCSIDHVEEIRVNVG